MATLTASGNGRWATVVVEVNVNGSGFTSAGEQYDPWRIEHDIPMSISPGGTSVIFRAIDAKNNGSTIGLPVEITVNCGTAT